MKSGSEGWDIWFSPSTNSEVYEKYQQARYWWGQLSKNAEVSSPLEPTEIIIE